MRILLCLLAMVATPAWAEWVAIAENESYVLYADPNTIRRNGDKVKMWGLQDFKTVQALGRKRYVSMKSLSEYNCKNEQIRLLFVTGHSNNMGGGESIDSDVGKADWLPVVPKSTGESEWTFACRHVLVEERARIEIEVNAFAADPEHPYFDELSDEIVAILKTGASLAEAYEKAVWANPVTREKEILRRQKNSNSGRPTLPSRQ